MLVSLLREKRIMLVSSFVRRSFLKTILFLQQRNIVPLRFRLYEDWGPARLNSKGE